MDRSSSISATYEKKEKNIFVYLSIDVSEFRKLVRDLGFVTEEKMTGCDEVLMDLFS